MIEGTFSSPVSTEVRSISTLLLILAPAAGLLIYTSWSLRESYGYGRLRDNRAAAQIGERPSPGSPPAGTIRSWDDLRACPYSRRGEFVAGMRSLLTEFERRHSASGDSPRAVALREAQSRMRAELNSLELATGATWDTAKQEVGEARRNLQTIGGDVPLSNGS